MGRLISVFTDYSQLENRVTNYCGLLLKLIYEDSPRRFSELLDKLTEGTGNLIIGPVFEQQDAKHNGKFAIKVAAYDQTQVAENYQYDDIFRLLFPELFQAT